MAELNSTNLLADANLQGYWRMEGNSNDTTANAYNGSDTGISYSSADGKYNQGSLLDGSTSNIAISGANLNVASSAFSFGGWVKFQAGGTNGQYVLNKQHSSGNVAPHFGVVYHFSMTATTVSFALSTSGASNQDDGVSGLVDMTGIYTHIACTYDGTNKRVYVNGILKGTFAQTGTVLSDTGNLIIGARTVGTSGFLKGSVDDAFVFNRVLTAAEILNLYTDGGGSFLMNFI